MISLALAWVLVTAIKEGRAVDSALSAFAVTGLLDALIAVIVAMAICGV